MNLVARPLSAFVESGGPDTGSARPQPRRDSLLRRLLAPGPGFELLDRHEPLRQDAEAWVAARYAASYQASLKHFLPWLFTMRCLGSLSGVAGLGPAGTRPLFLERYLPAPVETLLAQQLAVPVQRRDIVEVGNLAADQRGASHLLFVLFSAVLQRAGYRWIVFTATRALRNNLDKLGFPLHTLGEASITQVPADEQAAWGRYYDTSPVVVAGDLAEAFRLMQERPLLRRVLRLYRYEINFLAARLRQREEG